MRFERTPAARFLIARNRDLVSGEAPFDGSAHWDSQLNDPKTFRSWWNLAIKVSMQQLGHPQDAEDNAAGAVERVLASASTFKGGSDRAWFLRVLVNNGYDRLRKRQRRPEDSLELHQEAKPESVFEADPRNTPERVTERRFVYGAIQTAIESLGDDFRRIILLRDVEGLKYEEIAAELGIPEGTVKSRLSRARVSMRKILVKEGVSGFDFLSR